MNRNSLRLKSSSKSLVSRAEDFSTEAFVFPLPGAGAGRAWPGFLCREAPRMIRRGMGDPYPVRPERGFASKEGDSCRSLGKAKSLHVDVWANCERSMAAVLVGMIDPLSRHTLLLRCTVHRHTPMISEYCIRVFGTGQIPSVSPCSLSSASVVSSER